MINDATNPVIRFFLSIQMQPRVGCLISLKIGGGATAT